MKPWGKSISLDLYGCNLEKISNPATIKEYILAVIKEINMVAHGECHVERFGSGSLEGYSAMQFIETSSITIHCDEPEKRAFIDIFSCKDFDVDHAAEFSKKYFEASDSRLVMLVR